METIQRDESASIKGLLICLVVLGHNWFFGEVFPKGTQEWLYSFHVPCFFILPFFYSEHVFSLFRLKKNFLRLLWPYSYMFFSLFFLNAIHTQQIQIDCTLLNTWVTGNPYALSHYTGFQYLWFLPAMFSMLYLKDIFTSTNSLVRRIMLVFGFVLFIVFWVFFYKAPCENFINRSLSRFSVFSFFIGFAMLFVGWLSRRIVERWQFSTALSIFLLLGTFFLVLSTSNTSAYSITRWTSRIVGPFAGFSLLYNTRERLNNRLLRNVGELSLPVYLFHQPINYAICSVFNRIRLSPIVSFLVSFLLVLFVAYYIAKWVMSRKVLRQVLFPR